METYTIREISQMFNLPASTLRYYEEKGILVNVKKNSSGQRVYTNEHIERLNCINCFKNAGMTLSQLRSLFEYEVDEVKYIDEIIELLTDQQALIQKKLSQTQTAYEQIQRKVRHYKAIKDSIESGTPRPCWGCENKNGEP